MGTKGLIGGEGVGAGSGTPGEGDTAGASAIYTVPNAFRVLNATVIACNTSATAKEFDLLVSPNGAAASATHYRYSGFELLPSDTYVTPPFALGANDVVRALADAGVTLVVTGTLQQ